MLIGEHRSATLHAHRCDAFGPDGPRARLVDADLVVDDGSGPRRIELPADVSIGPGGTDLDADAMEWLDRLLVTPGPSGDVPDVYGVARAPRADGEHWTIDSAALAADLGNDSVATELVASEGGSVLRAVELWGTPCVAVDSRVDATTRVRSLLTSIEFEGDGRFVERVLSVEPEATHLPALRYAYFSEVTFDADGTMAGQPITV